LKTSLIILTFNEIEGITALFDKIPFDKVDEALVVDGGSKDGTIEFFKARQIPVYLQDVSGRGEAFRIGCRKATGDALIFFGPDGNEDPNDITKLLDIIKDGYDMAIASRFLPGARNDEADATIPYRAMANRLFTLAVKVIWGGSIADTINGFRAVNKDSFNELKVDAEGFAIEFQMSIRALKLKQRVKEIPTIEGDRIGGESTAKSIPTGLKVLRVLLREIWLRKNF
jgi:glycosyltransferase involved in cell wall biosynthesis